jgi:hypothetical protein
MLPLPPNAYPAGWRSTLKLQASVVTVKDACAAGDRGLLRPLLKHAWSGSCNETVFGSGVRHVTAVHSTHCTPLEALQ